MRRSATLMVLAGVVALAATSATAQAANPGADGLIAFVGVHFHISVVRPDGTGLKRLTNGSDQQPSWSPDGSRIVFQREVGPRAVGRIFVMNADGSDQHQLFAGGGPSSNDFWPSYSPNGTRVAFVRIPHTASGACRSHIMIGIVATGALREIPRPVCDLNVSWSPTSSTLLFAHPTRLGYGLYTYNLATGTTRMVAGSFQLNADWSPDGGRIVFDRETVAPGGGASSTNLFTIRPDGTGRTRITDFPPAGLNDPSSGANAPAYSPSGDAIAFFFHKPQAFDQLAILSPANRHGTVTYLPVHGSGLDQPTWQPR